MWEIWKAYSSIVFGEGRWDNRRVIELTRRSIYEWTLGQEGKKHMLPDNNLAMLGLIPKLSTPRCMVIRGKTPPPGRHKLNVDAAHGKKTAAAGALLRDSTGGFIGAISFALPTSTPDQAEMQAVVLAVLYFARYGYHLDVETDAQGVLMKLRERRSSLTCILHDIMVSQAFTVDYIPREINKAAHYLAQYGQQHPQLTLFSYLRDLPPLVRATI